MQPKFQVLINFPMDFKEQFDHVTGRGQALSKYIRKLVLADREKEMVRTQLGVFEEEQAQKHNLKPCTIPDIEKELMGKEKPIISPVGTQHMTDEEFLERLNNPIC